MPDLEVTHEEREAVHRWVRAQEGTEFVQFLSGGFMGTGLFVVNNEPLALVVERVSDGTKGGSFISRRLLCSDNHAEALARRGIVVRD